MIIHFEVGIKFQKKLLIKPQLEEIKFASSGLIF